MVRTKLIIKFLIKNDFKSMINRDFRKFMRAFTVSALLEGYRVEETIHAVSIHHAIKIMKAKYGNSARNIYVLN